MYSKEESANIRKEFWLAFGVYSKKQFGSKRKWITYNTGIKDFALKFDVTRKSARVLMSVENRSEDKRFGIFVKLKEYELLFEGILDDTWVWNEQFELENGKIVCALYKQLDNVSINDKEQWTDIFNFLSEEMLKLEEAFEEVKPFIKEYIKFNF